MPKASARDPHPLQTPVRRPVPDLVAVATEIVSLLRDVVHERPNVSNGEKSGIHENGNIRAGRAGLEQCERFGAITRVVVACLDNPSRRSEWQHVDVSLDLIAWRNAGEFVYESRDSLAVPSPKRHTGDYHVHTFSLSRISVVLTRVNLVVFGICTNSTPRSIAHARFAYANASSVVEASTSACTS